MQTVGAEGDENVANLVAKSAAAELAMLTVVLEGRIAEAVSMEDRGEARTQCVFAAKEAKAAGLGMAALSPISLRRAAENLLKFRD